MGEKWSKSSPSQGYAVVPLVEDPAYPLALGVLERRLVQRGPPFAWRPDQSGMSSDGEHAIIIQARARSKLCHTARVGWCRAIKSLRSCAK